MCVADENAKKAKCIEIDLSNLRLSLVPLPKIHRTVVTQVSLRITYVKKVR